MSIVLAADDTSLVLKEELCAAYSRARVPGICVAANIGGNRFYEVCGNASTDPAIALSPSSRFQLGCITKVLTALTAIILADDGALDLDAPVEYYLPELGGRPLPRAITSRHLLSHSGGYEGVAISHPEIAYFYSWEKFVDSWRGRRQFFCPGSVFSYEHSGFLLLGRIITRLLGCGGSHSAFKQFIFDSLGIHPGSIQQDYSDFGSRVCDHVSDGKTGYFKQIKSLPYSSCWEYSLSDLTLCTAEMLSVVEVFAGISGMRGVSSKVLGLMRTPVIELPSTIGGPKQEVTPSAFCLGIAQYAPRLFGHNGSTRGQTCGIRFSTDYSAAFVVAMNGWNPFARDQLIKRLSARLFGFQGDSQRPQPDLSAVEGRYEGAGGITALVSRESKGLRCAIRDKYGKGVDMKLAVDERGGYGLDSPAQHLSIGFFEEPISGRAALMVGLNAFVKSAEEAGGTALPIH